MTRRIDRVHEARREAVASPPQWSPEFTLLEEVASQVQVLHRILGLPLGVSLIFDPSPRIEVPSGAPAADAARAQEIGDANAVPVTVAVNDPSAEHEPRS